MRGPAGAEATAADVRSRDSVAARARRVDRPVRHAAQAGSVGTGPVERSVPIASVIATAASTGRRSGLLRALELVAPVLQAVFLVGVEVAAKRAFLPARRQRRGTEQHQRDGCGRFSRTC